MFENLKTGDMVSLCWSPSFHPDRRTGTDNVLKMTKLYVELMSGRRFSLKHGKEIKSPVNQNPSKSSYLCTDNSFWDKKEARDNAFKEMRRLFGELESAASSRNWEKTQEAFATLKNFIEI